MATSKENSCVENDLGLKNLPLIFKGNDFENCHVPKLPLPLFSVSFNKHSESKVIFSPIESALVLPASPIVKACLISAKQLTLGEDVKDTLELTFKFEDKRIEYDPGDSFGFICPNDSEEVDILLNRLDLSKVADVPASLVLDEECASRRKLPVYLPPHFSLRNLFLYHIEIRAVPKKILLRVLAEYTETEEERQCLYFLSSQEGSNYFTDFIRKPALSVLDILTHFKSCKPRVEKLIEYLPSLKPRFYSVASSPSVDKNQFKIVFNVVKIKGVDGRQRDCEGVCTGWFKCLSSDMLSPSLLSITSKISDLNFEIEPKTVFLYRRKNHNFKFPNDLKTPVIMVGPGTGLASFIGYLQHRENLLETAPVKSDTGETWLFYGCRYKERDFLFKKELDHLVQKKVLQHLVVSFSRDNAVSETAPRYVHENIKLHAQKITDCIKAGGKIFVCGDAKHMVHDVQQAFILALQIGLDTDETEAKKMVESLQKEQKYVNDVWA